VRVAEQSWDADPGPAAVTTVRKDQRPDQRPDQQPEQGDRLQRWQSVTDRPLLTAALLFLPLYAAPILRPDLPTWAARTCAVGSALVWAVFAVDLAVRVALAERRVAYLLTNWLDVIAVALPMLRPLRALRAVMALNVLTRRGHALARGRVVAFVAAAVTFVGAIAALAILDAERANPDANISSYPDALWWAATTVTTVGYGDRFPTTGAGRMIAGALMATGIALVGVVTAALASWFVERLSDVQEAEQQTSATVDELLSEVRELRRELARLAGQPGSLPTEADMQASR
jgi:voltage-gated potassium channel